MSPSEEGMSHHPSFPSVYKVSMPLYMLFIMGAGLSENFAGLLVCRMLVAVAGAPCLAVGAGTVADLFKSRRMAAPGALVVMTPFLGPCEYYHIIPH
jgi:MFS family permease